MPETYEIVQGVLYIVCSLAVLILGFWYFPKPKWCRKWCKCWCCARPYARPKLPIQHIHLIILSFALVTSVLLQTMEWREGTQDFKTYYGLGTPPPSVNSNSGQESDASATTDVPIQEATADPFAKRGTSFEEADIAEEQEWRDLEMRAWWQDSSSSDVINMETDDMGWYFYVVSFIIGILVGVAVLGWNRLGVFLVAAYAGGLAGFIAQVLLADQGYEMHDVHHWDKIVVVGASLFVGLFAAKFCNPNSIVVFFFNRVVAGVLFVKALCCFGISSVYELRSLAPYTVLLPETQYFECCQPAEGTSDLLAFCGVAAFIFVASIIIIVIISLVYQCCSCCWNRKKRETDEGYAFLDEMEELEEMIAQPLNEKEILYSKHQEELIETLTTRFGKLAPEKTVKKYVPQSYLEPEDILMRRAVKKSLIVGAMRLLFLVSTLTTIWWIIWCWILADWDSFFGFICWIIFIGAELVNLTLFLIYGFNFWNTVDRKWKSLNLLPNFAEKVGKLRVTTSIMHYKEEAQITQRTLQGCLLMRHTQNIDLQHSICDDSFLQPKKRALVLPKDEQTSMWEKIPVVSSFVRWKRKKGKENESGTELSEVDKSGHETEAAEVDNDVQTEDDDDIAQHRSDDGEEEAASDDSGEYRTESDVGEGSSKKKKKKDREKEEAAVLDVFFPFKFAFRNPRPDDGVATARGFVDCEGAVRISRSRDEDDELAKGNDNEADERDEEDDDDSCLEDENENMLLLSEKDEFPFLHKLEELEDGDEDRLAKIRSNNARVLQKISKMPYQQEVSSEGIEMVEKIMEVLEEYLGTPVVPQLELVEPRDCNDFNDDSSRAALLVFFVPKIYRRRAHKVFITARIKRKTHHYKAGAMNNLIYNTPAKHSQFVAFFDNDMRPQPDYLLRTLPWFYRQNPKGYSRVAHLSFVQTPLRFAEQQKGAEYSIRGNNYIYTDAIQKGRDAENSCVYLGSGAIFSMSALKHIGGLQLECEVDAPLTSAHLHKVGYTSRYVHEDLVIGDSPATAAATFMQKLRSVKSAVQLLWAIRKEPRRKTMPPKGMYPNPRNEDRPTLLLQKMYVLESITWPFSSIVSFLYCFVALIFLYTLKPPMDPEQWIGMSVLLWTFIPYFAARQFFHFIALLEIGSTAIWVGQEVWFGHAVISCIGIVDALYQRFMGHRLFKWTLTGYSPIRSTLRTIKIEWFNMVIFFLLLLGIIMRFIAFLLSPDSLNASLASIFFAGVIAIQLWPYVSMSLYERIHNADLPLEEKKDLKRYKIPNYVVLLFVVIVVIGVGSLLQNVKD